MLLLTTLAMGKKILMDDKQPLDAAKDIAGWVSRGGGDKNKGFEKGS